MQEPDLDDSRLVDVVTWTLYLGWLTGMAAIALYLQVEPLPWVQAQVPGTLGTVLALGSGVAFILVARQVYDRLVRSYRGEPAPGGAKPVAEPPEAAPPKRPQKAKRRAKKTKQKKGF